MPIQIETIMIERSAVCGEEIHAGGFATPIERNMVLIGPEDGLNMASHTTDTAVIDVIYGMK
jgi:hypothetical protein